MMQDREGVAELLTKLAEDNAAQNRYLRKQLVFTRIFAISCCVLTAAVLVVLMRVIPPLLHTMDTAVTALGEVSETLEQASGTLAVVDDTLIDIQSLFEEDGLVGQSSVALQEATNQISSMDIESLNAAIRDLGEIVEPMADFFGKFKR